MLTKYGADFPFDNGEEQELFLSAPEGNLGLVAVQNEIDLDALQSRLMPYRCTTIRRSRPEPGINKRDYRAYSEDDLRLHVFEDGFGGMLMAVDGDVFNITGMSFPHHKLYPYLSSSLTYRPNTGYADSHPGGKQIVHDFAGRDATDEFKRSHANWEDLLDELPLVGHLVPYRERGAQLNKGEVASSGLIYKLGKHTYTSAMTAWETSPPSRRLHAEFKAEWDKLEKYMNRDEPHHNTRDFALSNSAALQALVIAAVEPEVEKLKEISWEELEEHGQPPVNVPVWMRIALRSNMIVDPEEYELVTRPSDVWVVIGGVVYDVSSKFAPFLPLPVSHLFLHQCPVFLVHVIQSCQCLPSHYKIPMLTKTSTELLLYGSERTKTTLAFYFGKDCTDPDLIHQIVDRGAAEMVGKLVPGSRRTEPRIIPTREELVACRGKLSSCITPLYLIF